MSARQPDMHVRRRRDHPRNPAITARNIATGVSRRIRTLPPDGRNDFNRHCHVIHGRG